MTTFGFFILPAILAALMLRALVIVLFPNSRLAHWCEHGLGFLDRDGRDRSGGASGTSHWDGCDGDGGAGDGGGD